MPSRVPHHPSPHPTQALNDLAIKAVLQFSTKAQGFPSLDSVPGHSHIAAELADTYCQRLGCWIHSLGKSITSRGLRTSFEPWECETRVCGQAEHKPPQLGTAAALVHSGKSQALGQGRPKPLAGRAEDTDKILHFFRRPGGSQPTQLLSQKEISCLLKFPFSIK